MGRQTGPFQWPVGVLNIDLDAVAYEAVAFSETVVGVLTASQIRPTTPAGTSDKKHARQSALVTFETAGLTFRYTYDGTTPTTGVAGVGHLGTDGMILPVGGERNMSRLKFIMTSAGAGSARVTYHG
jgi:hypothetical protein